jgi:hypothetical protein
VDNEYSRYAMQLGGIWLANLEGAQHGTVGCAGTTDLGLMHRPISNDLRLTSINREKSNRYDPWYAKVAFGLFLCVLVGSLVALYSGVPVVQFVTRGL